MIFHITGCSGSGKTTLGKKLARSGLKVIDLDEIEDAISLRLLAKPEIQASLLTMETMGAAFKFFRPIKNKIFIRKVRQELKALEGKHNSIVLVGVTLKDAGLLADRKYFLESTPAIIYQRVNLRSLELISKRPKALARLFSQTHERSTKNSALIQLTMLFKFKIRGPFPIRYEEAVKIYNLVKNRSVREKYLVKSAREIFREILAAAK